MPKKIKIERSNVTFDVTPDTGVEFTWDQVCEDIQAATQDIPSVEWLDFQITDFVFGLKKCVCMCVMEDRKVSSVQLIQDEITKIVGVDDAQMVNMETAEPLKIEIPTDDEKEPTLCSANKTILKDSADANSSKKDPTTCCACDYCECDDCQCAPGEPGCDPCGQFMAEQKAKAASMPDNSTDTVTAHSNPDSTAVTEPSESTDATGAPTSPKSTKCFVCQKPTTKKCCMNVYFCSRPCQKKGFDTFHRIECKKLAKRKAAKKKKVDPVERLKNQNRKRKEAAKSGNQLAGFFDKKSSKKNVGSKSNSSSSKKSRLSPTSPKLSSQSSSKSKSSSSSSIMKILLGTAAAAALALGGYLALKRSRANASK